MIKILEAKPLENHTIAVKLDNGKSGIFDVSPFLDKGIFNELRDIIYFRQVKVHGRSVSWPHSQDFCADTIEALMT
ncbi:MAG: DUF2442 domain-containing protein [Chitinispirillaceae bacterium]|nr:DUF2442 domain-containing protein [Chitinispirillaceae bacterium]